MGIIKHLGCSILTLTMALASDRNQPDPWVSDSFTMMTNQLISLDYPCDDSFLRELPKHPQLTKVAFYPFWEKPTALKLFDNISFCPQLKEIIIRGIVIDGPEGTVLSNLPHLTSLDLNFCQILAPARAQLGKLKFLTSLYVSGVKLNDDQFLTICSSYRKLVHLSASHNLLTQKSALVLSSYMPLETLNISYNPIGDAGMSFLASIKTMKELYGDECGLSDKGLAHLSKMISLEKVYLAGNRFTAGCLPFLSILKNLKFIDLSRCGLSRQDIYQLRSQLPNTKIHVEEHISALGL